MSSNSLRQNWLWWQGPGWILLVIGNLFAYWRFDVRPNRSDLSLLPVLGGGALIALWVTLRYCSTQASRRHLLIVVSGPALAMLVGSTELFGARLPWYVSRGWLVFAIGFIAGNSLGGAHLWWRRLQQAR